MSWRKQKNYVTDYTVVLGGNGKKHWVYHGDLYQCAAEGRAWQFCRWAIPLFSLLNTALCVAASLVDPLSMRLDGELYVLISYAAWALFCLVGLFRGIYFCLLPRKVERMEYEKCIRPLFHGTLAIAVLAVVTCLAQVVYILLNHAFSAGSGAPCSAAPPQPD